MTINQEINNIAEEIKKEVNAEVDLNIGKIENPAECVPLLCERMDRICAMMDFQATLITYAEDTLEEAKYQYKKNDLLAHHKYDEAFVKFKQEDRPKPKDQRRTDKEYEAMASLESNIAFNEALSSERVYQKAQHRLDDEKHKYEILNNHFLSYRKACDLLSKEMNKLGGPREHIGSQF
jgi:hypothetical protein